MVLSLCVTFSLREIHPGCNSSQSDLSPPPFFLTAAHFLKPHILNLYCLLFHCSQISVFDVFSCMFPIPEFCITGQWYSCALEFSPVDKKRYQYEEDQGWFPAGKSKKITLPYRYNNPDKACLGAHLQKKGVAFKDCKLTNAARSENVSDVYFIYTVLRIFLHRKKLRMKDFLEHT